MNAVEFFFALLAVFGSTALWFTWLGLFYKIDNFNESKHKRHGNKEETIN